MEEMPPPSLRDILRILFKRKWQILLFFVGTVAMAIVASNLMFKSTYQATADLLLQVGREHVFDLSLASSDIPMRPIVKYDPRAQVSSATQMLKSRSLAEKVVNSIGAERLYDPVGADSKLNDFDASVVKLQEDIGIKQIGESSMLQISFEHPDPEVAAAVVNEHVSAFVEWQLTLRQNDQLTNFFDEQLTILEAQVKETETNLQKFMVENRLVGAVHDKIAFMMTSLVELEAEAKQTKIAQAGAERRISKLRSQLGSGSRGGVRSPGVMSAAQYQQVKLDLLKHEQEAAAYASTNVAQNQQIREYETEITRLSGLAGEYKRLNDQVKINQKNYSLYVTKAEESKVSSAMDSEGLASVKIVEKAYKPLLPKPSKLRLIMIIALGLGALLGFAYAFLAEGLSSTINTRRELEMILGVPVLATLPDGYELQTNN